MSDHTHKSLPKLRTFALDQAYIRGEDAVPTPTVTKPAVTKEEEPAVTPGPSIVVPSPKPTQPETTAKIDTPPPAPPAFHELKKQAHKKIEHIVATETSEAKKTVKVRDTGSAPLPRSFTSEATVITSGKKTEFQLMPSLITAFKDWLRGFGSKNKARTYTVSTPDRRKGVIQKATTKSGAIFTSSGDSLKQEITKKRETPLPETAPVRHLSWSAQTEPGFALLEEPDRLLALSNTPKVTVEYKKKTIPQPQIIEPAPVAEPPKPIFTPPAPEPAEDDSRWDSDAVTAPDSPYAQTKISIPVEAPQVFSVPTPPVQPAPTFTPPPAPVLPQNINGSSPINVPAIITENLAPATPFSITKPGTSIPNKPNPKSSYLRSGLNQLFRFDTTVSTVVIVGTFVSFVMVLLIVRAFVGLIMPEPTNEPTLVSLADPLTTQASVVDIALSSVTKEALDSALWSQPRPASGVVEFRLLEANGSGIAGNRLWNLWGFSADPNLSRSISELRLGYAAGDPILVLKVTDTMTVFGAMLSFEPWMGSEIARVFNVTPSTNTVFTDETIAGADARILKDSETVLLVYGFIDENILIIAPSVDAFETVLGK